MTSLASSVSPTRGVWRRCRLIRAEILKLRKRRGLVATAACLTVGVIAVLVTVAVVLHAVDPGKYEPAGGASSLRGGVWLLTLLGSVAGILVGATAGASDIGAGVFRELVVTGRSRLALFGARIPGGLAFLLAFVGLAYAIIVGCSTLASAGSLAHPGISLIVNGGLWLLLVTGFWFAVALGLASLLGSRTTPIIVMLPFYFVVSPLLANLKLLGVGREAFPEAALVRLLPHGIEGTNGNGPSGQGVSLAAAVLVLAVWVGVSLAVGAWRTCTRDA